jgi:C-5 cytosine-specific DNA methylase
VAYVARNPLAIDLFCGLGGWTEGLLAENYRVIGFDIERHIYGPHRYPAQLVIQDVLTLHGSQFRDATLIVASPPCQAYSYRAMPWKRAKALPPPDNALFEACFRIQLEACEAAGRHIPLIVENVRGAQKWVGRARWSWGSFYFWGADVPALMPPTIRAQSAAVHQYDGIKCGGDWFGPGAKSEMRNHGSKSPARKMASAMIAKIPLEVSRWIAKVYYPSGETFRRDQIRMAEADDCRAIPFPLSTFIARTFKNPSSVHADGQRGAALRP